MCRHGDDGHAGRILWKEQPGGLQSIELQRVEVNSEVTLEAQLK